MKHNLTRIKTNVSYIEINGSSYLFDVLTFVK